MQAIGLQYFSHLIGQKQYEQAAELCRKILGKNKELWEEHICCFAQLQQIGVCIYRVYVCVHYVIEY